MLELTAEMERLWDSLGPLVSAPTPGHGRVVHFLAARSGEGTSAVSREFARYAARRARGPVWLVDADIPQSEQYAAIGAEQGRFGVMGVAAAASPNGSTFFNVHPPAHGRSGAPAHPAHYLVAYPIGGPKLWVTRFRREALQPHQTVHVIPSGAYWASLRQHAELVIVDSPAADRSQAGITLAPFMDATVMVLAADGADAAGPAALKTAIAGAGGRLAGVFVNRVDVEPPAFLKSVLR